jgi:hypothetical protein
MPKPLLNYNLVHTSPLTHGLVAHPFWHAGAEYQGIQPSGYEQSERSWDHGDPIYGQASDTRRGLGSWFGPGAYHGGPHELSATGATLEPLGHDSIARIASGAPLSLTWVLEQVGFVPGTGVLKFTLQNADGSVRAQNATAVFGVVPDGPYLGWGRQENVERQWRLPDDYLEVRGFTSLADIPDDYRYTENNVEYVWDWLADVGRRPASAAHPYYALHLAAKLDGTLIHRGAWTQFIVQGGQTESGPYSVVRIVVGAGAFSVAPTFQPFPGEVLERVDTPTTRTPVAVDPCALSITAYDRMSAEAAGGEGGRIAGTIASRSGVLTACWRFNDDESTELIGVNERNYRPVCEASLYPFVSDILEVNPGDGTPNLELVLTYSHLHRYDAAASAVTSALPAFPLATDGHPGGRCLRVVGNELSWFTENFGASHSAGETADGITFGQFYNTLRTLGQSGLGSRNGCAFHGHNCADVAWGQLYGIAQDKPFGDSTARRWIAYQSNKRWVASDIEPFSAASHTWQRVRAFQLGGTKLIVTGKETVGENAIWGVADGTEFIEYALSFRARRIHRATFPDGGECLYIVGRFVRNGVVDAYWSTIAIGSGYCVGDNCFGGPGSLTRDVCFNWDSGSSAYVTPRATAEAAGIIVANLKPYLWWEVDADYAGGGVWLQMPSAPTDGRAYLTRQSSVDAISYVLTGTPPQPTDVWCGFCVTVHDDGSAGSAALLPVPCCENAACVPLPPGWGYDVRSYIVSPGETPVNAIQVNDASDIVPASRLRKLRNLARFYPILWARCDSSAPLNDLTTYTQRIEFDRIQTLSVEARERVDVVVLIAPSARPCDCTEIQKRL